jgi:hypothetical protein
VITAARKLLAGTPIDPTDALNETTHHPSMQEHVCGSTFETQRQISGGGEKKTDGFQVRWKVRQTVAFPAPVFVRLYGGPVIVPLKGKNTTYLEGLNSLCICSSSSSNEGHIPLVGHPICGCWRRDASSTSKCLWWKGEKEP